MANRERGGDNNRQIEELKSDQHSMTLILRKTDSVRKMMNITTTNASHID